MLARARRRYSQRVLYTPHAIHKDAPRNARMRCRARMRRTMPLRAFAF